MKDVFILDAKRTAIGTFGGALSGFSATDLGAKAIEAILGRNENLKERIDTIYMGNVLSANLGQAPARIASKAAGLPDSVCATTVNKVCASGLKAIGILRQDIQTGQSKLGIAGGMESMSNVPYYLNSNRFGKKYGHDTIIDGLMKDGLTDVYHQTAMGVSSDLTADKYGMTREELDQYSIESYTYAKNAIENKDFQEEIVPISLPSRKGEIIFTEDEQIGKANFEKLLTLKPAFNKEGKSTAGNSSALSDGGSALLLGTEEEAEKLGIQPLAKILAYAEAEQDPQYFTTTPVLAVRKILEQTGIKMEEIGVFEVNEAFATVPLAFMKELSVPREKVNIMGGAIALGHPLGNSGSRIVCTLLTAMKKRKAKYGIAAICNGGGGGSAILISNW